MVLLKAKRNRFEYLRDVWPVFLFIQEKLTSIFVDLSLRILTFICSEVSVFWNCIKYIDPYRNPFVCPKNSGSPRSIPILRRLEPEKSYSIREGSGFLGTTWHQAKCHKYTACCCKKSFVCLVWCIEVLSKGNFSESEIIPTYPPSFRQQSSIPDSPKEFVVWKFFHGKMKEETRGMFQDFLLQNHWTWGNKLVADLLCKLKLIPFFY